MSGGQQEFCYRNVTLYKEQTLGTGSYGIVCKAKCDQLVCAAKIMHNALFKFSDPSTNLLLTKFRQECLLNSAAKHPNIVQYVHTYIDPETGLPVLLMELCDESLSQFLERSKKQLPYYKELDLSNDIAQALCYLHSNGVIHRDLTSNNVLLIAECRAKVTDFGMSKLISVNPRFTPLSMCPGNALYMSPEALRQPPQYSTKLDCFSWGVLAIQIMTRLFPDPGPQFNTVEETSGRIIHEVIPEDKRRQSHIELVDPKHALLALAIKCLNYNEKLRPSAEELCEQMASLCQLQAYLQSKENSKSQNQSGRTVQLKQDFEKLQIELQKMSRELLAKDRELRAVNGKLARLTEDLETSEKHAEATRQTLVQRDDTVVVLQQNIERQQHIISTLRAKLDEDDNVLRAVEAGTPSTQHLPLVAHGPPVPHNPPVPPRSKQSLSFSCNSPLERKNSAKFSESLPTRADNTSESFGGRSNTILAMAEQNAMEFIKEKVMKLNIYKGDKAPEKMARGATVVNSGIAYFACFSSNKVHYYQCLMGREKWGSLPRGPYVNFSLAMINGKITMIGGCKTVGSDQLTNTLHSFEGNKRKWVEIIPPMPTRRQESAVVSTEHFVVVVGGRGVDGGRLNVVEVFRTDSLQWHVAGHLPLPLTRPTATICGEEIFIGSGSPSHGIVSKAVYCSTLSKLLSPYYTFPASHPKYADGRKHSAWREIARIQADHYTLCTLNNNLIAVGGVEMTHCSSSAVRKYDSDKNEWEVVGHINHGRYLSLAAVVGGDTLVVVGGGLGAAGREGTSNTVEIAKVCFI